MSSISSTSSDSSGIASAISSPLSHPLPNGITESLKNSSFLASRSWKEMNLSQVVENVRELRDFWHLYRIDRNEKGLIHIKKEMEQARTRLEILIPSIEETIRSRINADFQATNEISLRNANRLLTEMSGEHATNILLRAAQEGDVETVKFFILCGKVNLQRSRLLKPCTTYYSPKPLMVNQPDYMTALIMAVRHRRNDIVQLLINAKVDLNAKALAFDNLSSTTALMEAALGGNDEALQLLIAAKADLNPDDDYGGSALSGSIYQGHTSCATLLIDARADIHAQTMHGSTPLMMAAQVGNTTVIQKLLPLLSRDDLNIRDSNNDTALMIARKHDFNISAQLIINADATQESVIEMGTKLFKSNSNAFIVIIVVIFLSCIAKYFHSQLNETISLLSEKN